MEGTLPKTLCHLGHFPSKSHTLRQGLEPPQVQTQGVWQAGGHGKTPPDRHTVEAEVGALLDLEQYTRKVTREKAAYGPALGRAGARGAGEHEKPGENCTVEGKGKILNMRGSWPYSGGPQELEGDLGVGVGDGV